MAEVHLTEEEREEIFRAGDHHPETCDCSAYVVEQAFAEDDCCQGLLDTFAAVERILTERVAEAWGDGYNGGHEDARAVQKTYPDPTPNPYEQEPA